MHPTNKLVVPEETLLNKIYLIRHQKVMLDRDLAEIYGVKATRLREQVKRNKIRFPNNFMFQLNLKEAELMVSQNAIPSIQHLGGTMPYAFSEHGILMLANILKSEKAIKMSILIIELFIKLRETLLTHKDVLLKLQALEKVIDSHHQSIYEIYAFIKQMMQKDETPRKRIGFKE